MKFKLLTIFPEMLEAVTGESILGRARKNGLIDVEIIDIRAFSQNKHKNTDDTPFGGGAGMVMTPQPVCAALKYAMGENFSGKRIYMSPKGATFTQKRAEQLTKEDTLIILCGHYEGIDQRIIDLYIDEEISVGDYVLTGGELGALIVTDAVARLLPGVLGCDESSVDESFSSGLLEYPQFTRPRVFEGLEVPEVLLGGNQALIDRYRRDEALKITLDRRPELITTEITDAADRALIRKLRGEMRPFNVLGETEFAGRVYEESGGRIVFDADRPADGYIGQYVPGKRCFINTPRGDCFGFSPYAFDYNLSKTAGDEGIQTAEFFGINRTEFACCAATLLPVKKSKNGYIADYGKSRRAVLKPGAAPTCRIVYKDGTQESFTLRNDSNHFVKALSKYLLTGENPVTEQMLLGARLIIDAQN